MLPENSASTTEEQSVASAAAPSIPRGQVSGETRFREAAARVPTVQLTVVIPALNEEGNIAAVLNGVNRVCSTLDANYEVIVVDGGSRDRTVEEAAQSGATVVRQKQPGYGAALREAFGQASGEFLVTLDSDLSHSPNVIGALYRNRFRGEILIASRYVKGGQANMPWTRKVLSLILNKTFSRVLDIPVGDLSSGFRLYHRKVIRETDCTRPDFSFLQEVLVKAYSAGYRVGEVPFHYFPRTKGVSKASIIKFGIAYLKLLHQCWRLRNSVASADYDERAYDSWILPQRWWQRWRYRIITNFADRAGKILDIGCGSSKIFEALPGAVGLDLNKKKLRYRRALGNSLLCASLERLPVASQAFDQVICSEVIEHVPRDERIFTEFHRVLKSGGTLILGTPDYARWQWNLVEWVYGKLMTGGYAEEHITHYTQESLRTLLHRHGFEYLEHQYVFQGELIIKARKR
jgi:glycosyltransferase involved in cell wall biosynthesis